jgi:hypothetical protein
MKEVNVLALVKDNERYLFIYDDKHRTGIIQTLGRFAGNPELSLTWKDAAWLRKKIINEGQNSLLKNRISRDMGT